MATICTAQWSLYVPHSGHYVYRTVVTICTAQWSLYVPHSGHYMYHQFNIQQFYVLPTQLYLCVLCGSQNKQRLFPYTTLTDWFLVAFAKLRKAAIIYVMSVCPSVCPHGTTRLPADGVAWHLIFHYFSKICWESESFSTAQRYFIWRPMATAQCDRHCAAHFPSVPEVSHKAPYSKPKHTFYLL